jgi:hypothetical protein
VLEYSCTIKSCLTFSCACFSSILSFQFLKKIYFSFWKLIPSIVFSCSLQLALVASVKTENMSEESNSYGNATDILHQLEDILESDALM